MSTLRKIISTVNAPGAVGPYNQAVAFGNTLYLSGQLGMDPKTTAFVGDDVESQAHQALKNLGAVLEAGGSSFSNLVKVCVLLKDIEDFSKVNAIYAKYIKEPFPARLCYQAANLPKYAKVEIDAVAIIGEVKTDFVAVGDN